MPFKWKLRSWFYDYWRIYRYRQKCPSCKAIGTWNTHGGWLDRLLARFDGTNRELKEKNIPPRWARRWLCKYCGYFIDNKGVGSCHVGFIIPVWKEDGGMDDPEGLTPKRAVEQVFGSESPPWPWRV